MSLMMFNVCKERTVNCTMTSRCRTLNWSIYVGYYSLHKNCISLTGMNFSHKKGTCIRKFIQGKILAKILACSVLCFKTVACTKINYILNNRERGRERERISQRTNIGLWAKVGGNILSTIILNYTIIIRTKL